MNSAHSVEGKLFFDIYCYHHLPENVIGINGYLCALDRNIQVVLRLGPR